MVLLALPSLSNAASKKKIVADRDEFISVLAGIKHLQEDMQNVQKQLEVTEEILKSQRTSIEKQEKIILKLEEDSKNYKLLKLKQQEIIENLEGRIQRAEFWSSAKDYLMVGLVAVIVGVTIIN